MKPIGNLIRTLRKEAGYNQTEFGKLIGVSKQAVCNYESDYRVPDYITLEAIADVLNKPIGFFISDSERRAELLRINGAVSDHTPDEEIAQIIRLSEKLNPENRKLASDFLSMLLSKQ